MPESGRKTIGRRVDGYCYSSQLVYFEPGFGPVVKTMSYLTDQIAFFFTFLIFGP